MKSIISLSVAAILLVVPFASAGVQDTIDDATSPFDCFVPGRPVTQVVACLLEEVDPSPVVDYLVAIANYETAVVMATVTAVDNEITAMDIATAAYIGSAGTVTSAFVVTTGSNTGTFVNFVLGVPATATTFGMTAAHGECQFYTGASCPTAVNTRAGAFSGPDDCPPPSEIGYVNWASCVAFEVAADFSAHYTGVATATAGYALDTVRSTVTPTKTYVSAEGDAVDALNAGLTAATSTYAVALAGGLDGITEAGVGAVLAQCVVIDPALCAEWDGGVFSAVVAYVLP